MSYQKMASVYDVLMDDAPYQDWLDFTTSVLQQLDKSVKHIADLGCGTGRITTNLAEKGYRMTGIDFSEDMLSYAQQHATEKGVPVQWIQQDLRELEGFRNLDAVISYCDVLNYITTEAELLTVFNHAQKMLRDGGLFLFDVHSLHHVQHNLAGETFAEVMDNLSYIWFCSPGEEVGEMYHDLTFFVADEGLYTRFDESHHQRTFSTTIYKKILHEAGFKIRELYGDFSVKADSVHENTERIFFIAEKQPGK